MADHFRAAVKNIAKHGDTDIFPFPIENHVFFDKEDETVILLEDIEKKFDEYIQNIPPLYENNLTASGYTGFRWATQIDPIWNAYLLGLVFSIEEDIEKARLPIEKNMVFTYRFAPDVTTNSIFSTNVGWSDFQKHSIENAKNFSHVLICDIADFYPRIYHHRLENALKKTTKNDKAISRIMVLLSKLSDGISFGLPVGGPAARLLSELLLNRTDRLLNANGIAFCRFADDYHIFSNSSEEAYANLVFINSKLLENEGLSLQKSKTRVLTSDEFQKSVESSDLSDPSESKQVEAQQFLSLNLRYDPYSPTADDDYEKLINELKKFDIVGMLGREIAKSRIHQLLTKRLIAAVKHISSDVRTEAIKSLVDNFATLYPVFPNVMILLKSILPEVDNNTRSYVFGKTRNLLISGSHITKVPVNLDYALRVLAEDNSEETEELLVKAYRETDRMIIRRDIILIMAKRNADYWLSDVRKTFNIVNDWEKRSLLIGSYILEDEGSHWRKKIVKELSPVDLLIRDWAAEKMNKGWSIPI